MRPEDCVGQMGRALTGVAETGHVEVAGETFEALTIGPPIPAGELVEVTGWRLVDTRHVLSVHLPGAVPQPRAATGPKAPPTPPKPAGSSAIPRSLADELLKLQKLREAGVLTDSEFAEAKAAVLKNPPTPEPAPRLVASAPTPPTGPKCYMCEAAATTRCQSCGALSCAAHLQSIYVAHGHGGAYELRCESCYSSAEMWKVIGWVIFGIVAVIVLAMWSSMGRR